MDKNSQHYVKRSNIWSHQKFTTNAFIKSDLNNNFAIPQF